MNHFIKFGPKLLKKFGQIIKRAKWSKLGFLTGERKFLIFLPSQWKIGFKHSFKDSMEPSWPNHKVQKISNVLDWQMNFPVNWSNINCTLKSQTLTFWSKSSAKGHFSSRCFKTWNLFTKKLKFVNQGLSFKIS